jgi:hypothetical protein
MTAPARSRVELTVAVRDTDAIPKVPDAGDIRLRDGRRVQVMHNGVVVEADCYYGDWMTAIIRQLRGHHEPQEEPVFHAVVQRLAADTPDAAMVELGSYWAYYSLWLRHALPGARNVLVEPASEYLEVGLRNFALNGYDAVALRAAVGQRYDDAAGREPAPTPTLTIEEIMRRTGLGRIDLLHCDIQGGELEMLRESAALLRSDRLRFLVISTHHHTTTGDPLTHQRCLALLRDAGAHVIAEHSVSESCSGDGLIAVSMDPRDRDLRVAVTTVRSRDTIFGEVEYELASAMRDASARAALRAALGRWRARLRR